MSGQEYGSVGSGETVDIVGEEGGLHDKRKWLDEITLAVESWEEWRGEKGQSQGQGQGQG